MHKQITKTKKLVLTAMLLAAATMLSFFKLFELPFGGTVTPGSMMPIVLIAYLYGTRWGITSSLIYGVLQLLCGMGTVSAFFLPGESRMLPLYAVSICILDYILAYGVLGFAGVFKGKKSDDSISLTMGIILAVALRYIVHTVSGALFFGAWAEWFFADSTGLSQIGILQGFCTWVTNHVSGVGLSILYSVIYNGSYMIPELIITALVTPFVYRVLKKSNTI